MISMHWQAAMKPAVRDMIIQGVLGRIWGLRISEQGLEPVTHQQVMLDQMMDKGTHQTRLALEIRALLGTRAVTDKPCHSRYY